MAGVSRQSESRAAVVECSKGNSLNLPHDDSTCKVFENENVLRIKISLREERNLHIQLTFYFKKASNS